MSKKKGQVIITQFENPDSIGSDEGQVEYPQIQIVNTSGVGTRAKTKNKLIYIGEGPDGSEVYGQEQMEGELEEGTFTVSQDSILEVKDLADVKTESVLTFVDADGEIADMETMEGVTIIPKEKEYECELCNKKFTKVEILKRHIKTHIKDKEFKCNYCSKTFDRRDVLNDHIRNHTGEKPFECTVCKKKFTRGFVLLRHMRTHGEGLYKCDYCHKGFDRKDTFRDHMRNHTGEKPHKCKYCGKSFSRSFVLNKHEKSHQMQRETVLETNPIDLEFVDSDNVEVQEVDVEDFDSVKQATELLLRKEMGVDLIEGEVEQEIVQDEHDFKVIEHSDIVEQVVEHVEQVEEVVETEAITLATADGQIVRVISKEQYDRLLAVASKSKTYKCDKCNRRFTNTSAYQNHFNKGYDEGGCR